jgi:hypothetical protein
MIQWPSSVWRATGMSIKEIEAAITKLPPRQLDELVGWLADYHQQLWDKQVEDDLESGRLDAVLAQVDKDYQAGLAKPHG